MPGLRTEDVWSSILTTKDIVRHNFPWNDDNLVVEEGIDTDLQGKDDQTSDSSIKVSAKCLPGITVDNGTHPVLQDKWCDEDAGERPANKCANAEPHDPSGCLQPSGPIHESCKPES